MNTDKIFAQQIANEYTPKDATKIVKLKKLDKKAKQGASIFVYSFGILSTLVFGFGMCLSMKVVGSGNTASIVSGIILGIIGIALISVNYPIYKKILEKGKQKYAFEILELAKEICDKEK